MAKKIVIFASGNGTNAENIIKYFSGRNDIVVDSVFTNNPKAKVIERAKKLNTEVIVFDLKDLYETGEVLRLLKEKSPDLIVLAGFLKKIPPEIVRAFKDRIINIHPALLPKYGGKGMYGMNVHRAVIKNKEKKSGITIHLVDEEYDHGRILIRREIDVLPEDTPESLAEKIHELEYENYPLVIELFLDGKLNLPLKKSS